MLLDLPGYLQKESFDCGSCSCRIVYEFLWKKRPLREFSSLLGTNGLNGTDIRAIEAFFRKEGFAVTVGEMSIEDLRHHANLGRPVICCVKDHYLVSRGVYRGRVYVADPATGYDSYSIQEFRNIWFDSERFGFHYYQFGLAIWVKD